MKLLRNILSHLILISFLMAVISVFYYRSFLLPHDVVGKIDGVVNDVYPPALSFASTRDYFWSIRGERIVSFDDLKIFEKEEKIAHKSQSDEMPEVGSAIKSESVLEIVKKTKSEKTDVVQSDSESKKELDIIAEKTNEALPVIVKETKPEKINVVQSDSESKKELDVVAKKTNEPLLVIAKETKPEKIDVVQSDSESKKELDVVAAKTNDPLPLKTQVIEPVEDGKGKKLAVVAKDSDTSSERELLVNARNSFNQGNISQSKKFYLELTMRDHDNADVFGELGNVYYSQGEWDKAGLAYYEAAVRLMTEGNYNQVVYLQRVIKGLNTEHAEKLSQLMMRQ